MDTNFQKIIRPTGYQVFLMASPAPAPFMFATHPWFVCVHDGVITRWEVRFEKNNRIDAPARHLFVNDSPPFVGIEKIYGVRGKLRWPAKLLTTVAGDNNSVVREMYDVIQRSARTYPFRDRYRLWGPNSNTYAQWVLNQFPSIDASLPYGSIGKNYHTQ